MMSFKLQLIVLAVSAAVISADSDSDYYEVGTGRGQPKFGFPARQRYVEFNTFCDEVIVREVVIQGRLKDSAQGKGTFNFNLRLEQNRKAVKSIGWSMVAYALVARSSGGKTDSKNRGYVYSIPSGVKPFETKHFIPFRAAPNGTVSWENPISFQTGRDFTMRILVQPSHFLILFSYAGEGSGSEMNTVKQYYGYFYEPENAEEHWNEYTDSMFDRVHIEGDAELIQFDIKSGGPFTDPSAIPEYVDFKPYTDRSHAPLTATTEGKETTILLYEGTVQSRLMAAEVEWEFNFRGKIGAMIQDDEIKFIFQDHTYGGDVLRLTASMGQKEDVKIESINNKINKIYSATGEFFHQYNSTIYDRYFKKYSQNPFKKNQGFEMSVRRLSYTDQSACPTCYGYDQYHGYPRHTVQITVRVACRIWTWYVHLHNYKIIDALKIIGDVQIYQAVLAS